MSDRKNAVKGTGCTQHEAAASLGISRPSIIRWMKGGDQTCIVPAEIDGVAYEFEVPLEIGVRLLGSGKGLRVRLGPIKKVSL